MLDVRRWATISGLAAAWLGCAAASDDEAEELPPVQPICDGSDDVRFVFTAFAGFPAHYATTFTGSYGGRYLVIDGRCNYWLGSDTLVGLRTGTIGVDAAATLAEELHFGRYASVADFRDPGQCTDAGLSILDDGTATLRSSCFQPDDVPRIYGEAFTGASRLVQSLDASAQPDWQRSTLLAINDPLDLTQPLPGGAFRVPVPWTAPLDLEPRSVTNLDLTRGLDADTGVLVEDEPTLAVLAELRLAQYDGYDLFVRDDRERIFQLLVRDEPPAAVRAALEAATAKALAP
ncbi:MAG TPA: hypothetical protein VMG12_03580 [Polyangiaceae bacterium]|nr:hypothetical protein [Polyangiaceae bacterium]